MLTKGESLCLGFAQANLVTRTGNPFDLRWALSTMARDGTIYYDYVKRTWERRAEAVDLNRDFHDEDSAARSVYFQFLQSRMLILTCHHSVFNGLSSSARLLLRYLACLPSRGVEVSLLARLINKSDAGIRSLLDECVASGSTEVTDHRVQFVHDKPHAAVLASISRNDRPKLFVTIARGLEGISTDYNFVQADMLLSAFDVDPSLLTRLEVVTSGEPNHYIAVNL